MPTGFQSIGPKDSEGGSRTSKQRTSITDAVNRVGSSKEV